MRHARFKRMVQKHKDRIYARAYYMLGVPDDAEDVTQEVLLTLWEHLHEVPRQHTTAWILKVTRNLCIDHLRQQKKSVTLDDLDDEASLEADTKRFASPAPDAHAEQKDIRCHIEREIRALREPLQSVVVLREIMGLSYEEIARATDIPLNSVKVYLYRARRILRAKLAYLME